MLPAARPVLGVPAPVLIDEAHALGVTTLVEDRPWGDLVETLLGDAVAASS